MADNATDGEARSGATSTGHRQGPQSPGWIAPVALLVAIVAVAVAVYALMSEPAEPMASDTSTETTGDAAPADPGAAKAQLCAAVDTVSRGVQLQTNGNLGPEPVAQTAVAANARLALLGGGLYLESQIGEDTPPELADPVRQFATTLQDIGSVALTGVTNQDPAQQERLTEGDRLRQEIVALCA